MEEVKRCFVCGKVIANIYETDYYKYIRLKYCPDCAKEVIRLNQARYKRNGRAKKRVQRVQEKISCCGYWQDMKIEAKYQITQLDLLKKENALLRQRLNQLEMEVQK